MKAAIILFGAFVLIAGNKVNSPPTPEECWAAMQKHAPKKPGPTQKEIQRATRNLT